MDSRRQLEAVRRACDGVVGDDELPNAFAGVNSGGALPAGDAHVKILLARQTGVP